MKLKWIDLKSLDLSRYKLLVVFKDQDADEVFSSIPPFIGSIRQEDTCILFIRFQEGRIIWQMYEIKRVIDSACNFI